MGKPPLISVLMTCYNREDFVAEAIESVLASTYLNLELIIVDDGSKDSTVSIAETYRAKDNRVKLYVNEKNLGDYRNRNRAASYATGKYLFSVDSDDKIYENGFDMCVKYLLQFPQARFATYYRIPAAEAFVVNPVTAINNHFFKENYLMIGPGGTIIEREYFIEINGFPEKYGPANDTYYNLKAACSAPVLMIPFMFYFYRTHPGQEIHNAYSYLSNNYRYTRDALNELPLHLTAAQVSWLQKKNNRRFLKNIFNYFIKTKDFKKTTAAIRFAQFSFKDAVTGAFHYYTENREKMIMNVK